MQVGHRSRSLRNLCAAAALLFCGYGVLLAGKSIAGFPASHTTHTHWPWLGDKPVGEDGFYMLSVAHNIATTGHMTYTYQMPATGIQPLSTVLFAGLDYLVLRVSGADDVWMLIRATIVLGTIMFVGFAWGLARFAASFADHERRDLTFALAFFLTLFNLSVFRLFTYGLETGLYLCCLLWCVVLWRRLVTSPQTSWRNMVLFGIAGGFAGLSRIDFGILFALLLAFLAIRRLATALQVFCAGLIALLLVSPWFVYVHSVSGSWLPSSGKAESVPLWASGAKAAGRFSQMALSWLAHFVPWSFAGSSTRATTALALVSVAGLLFALRGARRLRAEVRFSSGLRLTLLPWLAGVGVLSVVYVVFFWSVHFYTRYTAPLVFVSVPLLALGLSEWQWVYRYRGLVFAVLMIIFSALNYASLHTGHMGSSQLISAGYVHSAFAHGRIGAFQSGTVAYFNPNVVNLDGKLNQDALRAAQLGELDQYLAAAKIDVLVDWRGYLDTVPSTRDPRQWQPCPVPMPSPETVCLERVVDGAKVRGQR